MIPTSIISGISSRQRGFSFYLNRELTSVLGPGIVLAAQLSYFVVRLHDTKSEAHLFNPLTHLSGTAGVLVLIFAVAVGYIVGYVQREIAFNLLAQFERLPSIKKGLEESPYSLLRESFSESLINEALQKHEYLALSEYRSPSSSGVAGAIVSAQMLGTQKQSDSQRNDIHEMAGGGNVRSPTYNDFSYAKIWIRNYAPGFSIDFTELEINITVATLFPAAALAADIDVSFGPNVVLIGLTVVLLAVIWYVFLRSLFRLRRTERREAIRNLVLDYAMRCTAQQYPYAQAPASELQDEK